MQKESKDSNRKIRWKQGSSMVEILVAFLIVVMTVVGFSRVLSASNQLLQKSRQVIAQTTTFDAEFYKKDVSKTSVDGKISLQLQDTDISLPLSKGSFKKVIVPDTGMSRYLIESDTDSTGGGTGGE